jgi:hypothetical protein
MTHEPPGVTVLKEVAEFLEANGIDYWLGRGRFRHFTLHGAFGDAESDIDFHVLRRAAIPLRAVLPELVRRGYTVTDSVSRHKLALKKGGTAVEFVYLDQATDDPDTVYHETAHPQRKRFVCPASVFAERRLTMYGAAVRVPEEEYLPCVFGPRWRDNKKGSGGVEIPVRSGR